MNLERLGRVVTLTLAKAIAAACFLPIEALMLKLTWNAWLTEDPFSLPQIGFVPAVKLVLVVSLLIGPVVSWWGPSSPEEEPDK